MSQTLDEWTAARSGELTESERYDLLSDEQRRAILAVLERQEPPVDLDELAAELSAGDDADTLDGRTERQVKISLHHRHLPKMSDLGIIEYDPESNRIDP